MRELVADSLETTNEDHEGVRIRSGVLKAGRDGVSLVLQPGSIAVLSYDPSL